MLAFCTPALAPSLANRFTAASSGRNESAVKVGSSLGALFDCVNGLDCSALLPARPPSCLPACQLACLSACLPALNQQ